MNTIPLKRDHLKPFIVLFDAHSKSFYNVLEGFTDIDAQNRLNSPANHVAWLAGSLVHERFEIANFVGLEGSQTSDELFFNHKGIQNGITYPQLDEFKADWKRITPILKVRLLQLSEEELSGPDPFGMPGGDYTLFDALTFCIDREAYCIGQIGLYRRLLNYPPMKYA